MEPILVPGPSKEAFNKNRRISDLIKAQIAHLKHVEYSFTPEQKSQVLQHPIVTENDAARYIASMTQVLLASSATVEVATQAKKSAATKTSGKTLRKGSAASTRKGAR